MLKQRKNKDLGAVGKLLRGLLICTLLFFSFMLIMTLVRFLGDDPTYRSELWAFCAFLLSGAVAGAIIRRISGGGGLLIAAISALELVLILFLIAVITSGVPSLPSLVNYGIYVGTVAITAFLVGLKPKRRRRRR
jgi:hypothetical protein